MNEVVCREADYTEYGEYYRGNGCGGGAEIEGVVKEGRRPVGNTVAHTSLEYYSEEDAYKGNENEGGKGSALFLCAVGFLLDLIDGILEKLRIKYVPKNVDSYTDYRADNNYGPPAEICPFDKSGTTEIEEYGRKL